MFLVRFFPAVFVFGLAALGYWLTSGGTTVPEFPSSGGAWFTWSPGAAVDLAPESALIDLFRFDATPRDLGPRWKKEQSSAGGQVFRAELQPGDLALDLTGSVLYHFTPRGALKRVVLAGTTTEPEECAEYAEQAFGFELADSGETTALLRGRRRDTGLLRLTQLASTDSHASERFRVEWTVERPLPAR